MKRLGPRYWKATHPKRWNLQHADNGLRKAEERQKGWKMVQGTPRPASQRPKGWFF